MLLANLSVQGFVTEQVNAYLTKNKLTFLILKEHILSKAPIPPVHLSIIETLTAYKKTDQKEAQEKLEKQAYKNQLAEDEKQKKQEHSAALNDEELKEKLTRELNHIPTQLNSYETESTLLKIQLAKLLEVIPVVEVTPRDTSHHHEHPSPYPQEHQHQHQNQHEHQVIIEKPVPHAETDHAINRLKKSILEYDVKTIALTEQKKTIQKKLRSIEERARARLTTHLERVSREQAISEYNRSKNKIMNTLSPENQLLLSRGIQKQYKFLEQQCEDLIKETEQINYIFFIEQLHDHLNKNKYTSSEIEAINAILKSIKKHLQFEHKAASIQDNIEKKKQLINSQRVRLQGLQEKLHQLMDDNPSLTSNNEQLNARNKELGFTLEYNNELRQSLGTPALLLLALTFLFVIPLILIFNGIIPLFLAPALLYTLFAIPPALLFIATLVTGISAAVYAYKAYSNQSEIDINQQTIQNNTNQMNRNTQDLQTLQKHTIPNLEEQIRNDGLTSAILIVSLQEQQNLSKQAFKKATDIEPVGYATSPFLSEKNKRPYGINEDETISSTSSDEEEEMNSFDYTPV